MGKTDIIKIDPKEEKDHTDSIEINLPIPFVNEEKLSQMFSGKYIGIVDQKIIAVDSSLRKLQLKVREIIPKGKDCTVEFFEDEVSIYGSRL